MVPRESSSGIVTGVATGRGRSWRQGRVSCDTRRRHTMSDFIRNDGRLYVQRMWIMSEVPETAISCRSQAASIEHADASLDKSLVPLAVSEWVTTLWFSGCHPRCLCGREIPLAEDLQKQDDGNTQRVCLEVLVGDQSDSSRQLFCNDLEFQSAGSAWRCPAVLCGC